MKLEIGTTYYMLTFADVKQSMPGLEPLVYIGKDIFDEDSDNDKHYFQDSVSVVRFGILGEGENITVRSFKESEIGSSIITLEKATKEISDSYKRYLKEGKPKLKKVSGKWITIENS